MRRKILLAGVISLSLLVGGCEAISNLWNSPLAIDIACETATSALTVATVLKVQGELSANQISSVGKAIVVIDPICGATTRPTNKEALSMVKDKASILTEIIGQ